MLITHVQQRLQAIARDFGCETGIFGYQYEWPLLWLRRIIHQGPVLYLSAGIHGDEPAGVEALLQILERPPAGLGEFSLLACPVLNPAGLEKGTRGDKHGVDLNRDYKKFSTDVTRAHRDFLLSGAAPELAVSFHEDWEARGFYLYEINTSTRPLVGRRVVAQLGKQFAVDTSEKIDGHVPTAAGYIHHPPEADLPEEWPEAIWLVKNFSCLSLTFETPSTADFAQRVAMHVAAFQSAVEEFLKVVAGSSCRENVR